MPRRNRAKHTSKMSDFKPDKWYPGDVMCPACIKYVDQDGQEIFPRINKFYRVGVNGTQTADYFSGLCPIDFAVLSVNA